MRGKICDLKIWRQDWAPIVYDWYESEFYSSFFRNTPAPVTIENFLNYPSLTGQAVWGIFGDKLLDKNGKPELVGLVTAYHFNPNSKTCSAGIMVRQDLQSHGIATDAFMTLFEYLFCTLNQRRISIEYVHSDEKIQHIHRRMAKIFNSEVTDLQAIESLPFFEGRIKKNTYLHGKYHDMIATGVFRKEYDILKERLYGRSSSSPTGSIGSNV